MNTCLDCGKETKGKGVRCHSCANKINSRQGEINDKGQFVPKYTPIQIGEIFGLWTVLDKGSFRHNQQRWKVRCECGVEKEVAQQHLRASKSTCCVKCAGKKASKRAFERDFGKYSHNRRTEHVSKAVEILYETQKGLCSICGKQLPLELSKCAWDHDHESGEGRDLLHKGCNVFLGFVERDPEIIKRLIIYCQKYKINYAT